nr:coiled-coil domain-containing protein 168 [Camelus dromedarius]
MSKQFYFFKKVVQGELEDDILLTLWDLLETWTSQNDWMAIFFIIFLVIIFEIVLIKICTSFQKKPALPEKDHSDAQEKEDSCLKSMKPDNWSMHSSSEEKADDFSERTIASSLASEENEGNFEGSVSPADETIQASTSESKYQVSHFSESHMPSSSGTSSFLSLFHSEVKEAFLRRSGYPEDEQETIQLSSKKLFSIMKNNKNENVMFSSDFNFSRTSRIIIESEDLDVVPCPSAHLLLSRDQVRLLEENVRNQIPLKSRATLDSKATCVYSRSQEPLIQNQQSVRVDISAQTQDSFPGQKAVQDQGFFEAQFTSQAQQFVNNQVSMNSQPDIEAKYFALPQDLMRKPPSSSTQDSFQAQDMDRSQHLVKVPYPVETQDSIKGLESDKKPLDEAQYPIWFEDPNKNEYSIQGQNAIFKNARFLVLTLSPDSVAKGLTQLKRAKTKGQKQTASSKVNQCPAYGSVPPSPTTNRQKNRRKILHSKSKFSLKVPPQRSKKTPRSRVLQITVGHTPERRKLRHKRDTQKKEFHHRKGKAGTALHLIYVFKLVLPYIRKYSRKKLVKFMPGLTGCGHFLLKQNKSGYAEKVNNTGSLEKRETSSSPKNGQQHGRDSTGLKSISPKIPPQLEQSFRDDTHQQKASLIETNWRNKGSLKDPIIQAKEMDIAEFCVPGSEKTSDPNTAKHETPLEEAISEHLQKFVFSPKMELDRKTKTWEDLKSAENAQFPLSSDEQLPASTSEMQRSSPKGNAQRQKDFLEIVLESSDVNLLISLRTRKHKSSEQLAGVKIQESTEDVIEKEKKPLILKFTEDGDLRESGDLECTPGSNTKNMQDQRISDAFHNATHTTISEPPPMEMQSRFKPKTDTSRMRLSPSAAKQDKLPDDKKLRNAKVIVVRCVFKKPQDHDGEEEQQASREAVPQLPGGFRFSLQLEREAKDVKFEAGQSSSESRTTQNKEREAQSQTLSPEMILGTTPCPTMDPFQAEKVKHSTDRPPGRETADPVCPLTASESLPAGEVLTETTECGVPFGGSPRKTPGHQMAEEKEDFRRVLSEVALASCNMHVLPSSYFKRQKIRKKLSGMKGALSPKRVIIQVKKPPICHPRRPRGDFKIIIKQILQDKTVADKLLNVIYLHTSILPHMRMYSRLNAENPSHTQLKQEKSEVEREETCSDTINKGSDSGNTKEDANLQDEVRRDKEVSLETALQDSWGLRPDAYPEKELKTKKEMHQPVTFAEIMMEPIYSTITDPFHAENVEKSLPTQTDLRYIADSETPPPASENSPTGDPLNQTGGRDVPDDGNDTRERGYFFAGTRSALPKDLPAVSPETFNCHMPALSHSKVKKNGVRFSHIECTVKPKSVHMKALKPSISKICSITGHRRKLESDFKAKFEKINQANGLVYEFLNTLYSPVRSGLQGETNSFCHAQVNFQELAHEGRPQYVDFFLKSHTFHDRGEKVEDGEEEEQKCLLITAPQHTQHLWIHAHQGKKTHLAEPDPTLDCLAQKLPINEQDMQHQTCFTRTALQTDLQMSSRETKGLQKTNKPEDEKTAPTGPASLPPETGKSSVDKPLNTATECDLPSGGNPKRELDSYFVEKNSELPENLQVTFLQSSDSVEHFVSKSKRKNTLKLARKPKTVSRRYRTMREEKPSILHMLNSRQNKKLQYSLKTKMKNPQQNKNIAGAFLEFIHFKVPILPNIKTSIRLNMETDMQRVTRLSQIQLTQEKSPNGREVCCPDSVDVSGLSNSVKDGKEEAGEHKDFPAPGNSQGFVFNIYQERDHDLVKSDEELKQPGSVSVQGPPQTHFAQTILSSTSGPTLGQFQFGKLGSSTRFSPPKSGEAKTDERMFSARECGVPSDANHQKEQAGGIEKKQTAALDFWVAAVPVSKSKRNFKQSSRVKTLVNPKCEIFKAKKPSISYMFNIKGGESPNRRKALGCNLTTKMKEVDQKTAGNMYSLMTIIPDVNRHRKREREKDMLGEKRLGSKQVKQETAPQEGTLTLDDTEETNFHDEEEEESEQEMFLKVLPQHSQHFVFCSGHRKELNLHKPESKGSGKILFCTEQDLAPQVPPTDPAQVEEPKRSHQTQSGALCTVDSNLPLLKSKEPLVGQVLIDTVKCGLPSDGSHGRDLHNQVKEEKAESHRALQAAVLESLDIFTPTAPESKRQRKTFPRRALKSKMHPRCVTMKARKVPISQVFNIPRNGGLKTLHPTTLKSQIIDLLIHIKYSGILEDLTAEEKEGLAQELPATTLEFLDISTLVSAVSKRKQNNVKLTGKRNKMSPKRVTLKAKKAPISQTFNSSKGGAPSHRRQWECNFKTMRRQGQSVADVILSAISSSMPVSLDVGVHNRIKIETGRPWKRKFSHELQQRGQSPGGEEAWGAHSREKRGWAAKVGEEVKDYGGEAAPRNSQHFTVHAYKKEEPRFVKSDLERKNSARKITPESLTIAQELQQHARFMQNVSHSVSCSVLNSLPFQKLPKRTKTQRGLKDTGSPKISSPVTEKSLSESLIVIAQSGFPSGRGPRKELASSVQEGKMRLQMGSQVRSLQSFGRSRPASSKIKGWRNAAQIPESGTEKAQMASVLKTVNITRSGALSHGKEQVHTLDDVAKEIPQRMSDTFMNALFSLTPVSPAIKTHEKLKAEKGPVREESTFLQLKQEEGKRLCKYSSNKWSTSSNTPESRWQQDKEKEGNEVLFEAGLRFLNRTGSRKDQIMLITEQDGQQKILASENILESLCSPLIIPFPTEKLTKTVPPQKDILHRLSEKAACRKSRRARFDGLFTGEAEYCSPSAGSPTRKPDVSSAVSLPCEGEEGDIKTQKGIKYTADQNIPPPKSGMSVLGDPCDKSARRKAGGRVAKKHKELQGDLLIISMMSVLAESKRHKRELKYLERKDLLGPRCVTMKATKPLCSQVLNITEHGNLSCRKEQGCNLKSVINNMQQNQSIADAFSSPTPVSTYNKLDIEMDGTPKTETDQPRVKIHARTHPEPEKSPCDREAWEANLNDTQNQSSNTVKMNVQCAKEEKNILEMLAESVPHWSQHFHFTSYHLKNLGSCKSESKLNSSEGRSTWNLSCAVQNMRQEKHVRETILEPVSRNVMNFIQVQTLKKSLHAQERIKYMVGLKTPFPEARKSETGSIQCDGLWNGNPRKKWDSPISQKKTWNQSDLVRNILKPLDFSSLYLPEPQSQSYALEFVEKKSTTSPKHVTLEAKRLLVSQLLNTARCLTGNHRKKRHRFKYKTNERQWNGRVRQTLFHATEGANISPSKLVIDKLSFNTTVRDTMFNNRTPHRNLNGHITEEKAELEKKEMRFNIEKQKKEFQQGRAEAELVLNTLCDSGSVPSQMKEFMEVRREKGRPQKLIHMPPQLKLEKSPNRRQTQSLVKSATSRNIKTLKQYIREQEENYRTALLDLPPQRRYQLVISQQVKKEPDCVKFTVNLKRDVYRHLPSQKRELSCTAFDISRIRPHTKHELLIERRVKEGDADVVRRSASAPVGREVSEKMDISLSPKGHVLFLTELAASPQKTHKEQERQERGSISVTHLEPVAYPTVETPHSENTGNVAEEDAYLDRRHASHLFGREGVKETAILQGSKRYTFLCTHAEVRQNMSAVQKGEMKPDCISASILDSVSCPGGEPLQVKEAANATGKEHVSIPVDLTVNPWRKEKSEGTDILLESNGQKNNFSKTQKAEQQNSSKQSKENILESMSSCIVHQLHTEKLKKEVSAKGLSPTVLSPTVEKASNKAYFPVAPTPGSVGTDLHTGGRKEHRQESTRKALPPSASHSLMDRLQVKLPRVKKALKEAESAKYHASDTEGIGLLFSGREEKQPEYTNEALLKPASHSPAGRLHISTSLQRVKLDDTNMMHGEHSTPQAKEALKGMDVTVGYTQTSEKRHLPSAEQTQQHLLVPSQNFLMHRSYPQNDPWFLPQLVPPAKEALSEAGNVLSRTKGSDVISKAHLNTGSEYGLEWAGPLSPPRQTKRQNTMLPSESFSENIKYQDVSFPKGKKASDGAQVIDSVSHGSSKRREKAQLCKAYQKKAQKEVCLPGLFLHSFSVHLPLLPESKRQKSDVKQGLKKDVICPERTLMFKKSVSSDTFNTANYRTPGNRPELQWKLKEKMVNMKCRKVRPDLVVTNTYEFIPFSPYLKLNKKIIDEIISSDVKGIKHHISQKKKDRIKRVNMKWIMDPNVILKAKKSSLSHTREGEEWPVPLNIVKIESKVQIGKGKSGMKLADLLISLPSLSHPNLNSRIKVGKGKSGIPRSCLPPLKFQASLNIRKTSFPESISRDSLSDTIESKQHLPQKKKEDGEDTVYLKDTVHRKCATFRRKKKLFKLTPRGQEPQWNNKEQEEMMQGDKGGLDVVPNKPHVSIPSSSLLEWGPGLKEEAHMRGVAGLCFPSLTLQELSDAMITCEEPMDDILSSIKRAKYMPQKTEDKVEMEEEIRLRKRIALKANQSPTPQELHLNIKGKEEKMQEDSGEQAGIRRRPCLSVSSPPYSEVDTGGKREAVVLRKTRSPFPQPVLQDSSDTGKIAYKESTCGDTEEEERVKMAEVVPLKKNKSPISQEIQLDIKEQKKNIQRIKGEPGVVLTCTSLPAPSTGGDVSDDVKMVQEYKPQRGEDRGEIANMKYKIYPKGTTPKAKILLPFPHVPSSPAGCGPQIRDIQTNIRGNLRHVQDRTSERDDVLAGPCLPQFKLNRVAEGKEGSQGVVRPCLPSSWPKEASDTKRLKYTTSPVNDISRDSKGTKYTAQREEKKSNIFERDLMHPKGLALKANKSPLFHILRAKKLQVNIKEQVRRGQDGSKHTVVLLSKICPFVTSSAHLKFDTIKEEKGEPGIIRNYVSPLELQDSLSSVQTAPTKSADSRRKGGRQHPPPKEKAGVPAAALTARPNGTDVKAGTASPPHAFSVAELGAWSRRKEPQSSTKERVEQEQGRSGDPHVAPAKAPPSLRCPSHHRLDAGTKADAGSTPSQLQLRESSGAGGVRYADPSQGISSCNVIIKANRHEPCKEAKDRVTTKGGRDRRSPQVITLEAHSSALTHLLSGNRLPLDVKERGEEVVLRETRASLPSLSDLQRGPSTNQKEGAEGITQSCFPPLEIYDPFIPSQKADTRSLMLKEEDRLKTDTEDRVLPVSLSLDQKAKEPPLSHLLDTKKPWWEIKKQEQRVQRKDTELVTNLKNICISSLTLPCLKSDAAEGEGYVIRVTKLPLPQSQSKESAHTMKIEYAETTDGELAKDVREVREHMLQKEEDDREESVHMNIIVDPNNTGLKAKESFVLLTCNPSDLQWKTKEQEGEVQGAKREPGDLTQPETCTSRPAHLHPHENTSIKEESVPMLPRSSSPPVNFQKSSGSEEVVHVEPIASDTAISPQNEERRTSQNKGEGGAERGNLVFPKHQEKEMQESKAELGMVPTTSSTSLPSLPALSLDKEVQVHDKMLALERSVLPRISNAGEIVRTQSIGGDITKDVQNEEQPMPEKEERVRERTVDTRGPTHTTEITLKSKRIPPSYMLHRTELHLNIRGIEPKKQEGQGNPPSMMLRKMYVSIPPTELKLDQGTQVDEEGPGMKRSSLQRKILVSRPRIKLKLDKGTQVDEGGLGIKRSSLQRKILVSRPLIKLKLDKGTQVDEERLGIKRPSLLPLMLSALSDAEKRADSKGTGKQHTSEKEKKYDMKKVDMRIRMHHKEGRISPISHVLGTKEFVLNVIKEPGRSVHKGKDKPGVVLTRTFLSIPSAPLYLDSGSKMDKDVPGITGSSYPQQHLQESSDTQKIAIRESVSGDSKLVKNAEHLVPEEAKRQWTSNFMISIQQRKEPPRVKSEGDLSELNSRHEGFYFTGLGTIRGGKRLEYFFTGQEAQREKYRTAHFTTFLSFPAIDLTNIESLKKDTEIMNNLSHKISPQDLVLLPRKISKEICATRGTPVSSEGFSASEQDAHQQETLSKASPGSADSCKFDKPEEDGQNNEKISKMSPPKVLAKESVEKMSITESNASPNIEQEIVTEKQMVLRSGSGRQTRVDSSLSLKIPLQNGKQRTPLEIDVHKQTTVYPGAQVLQRMHMDITEFDAQKGQKRQALFVPEQKEHNPESLQKSLSSFWNFPPQFGDLEEKNETATSTTINLEQKKLDRKEGILKIDTNIAVHLEEDKIEMHKHTTVNLEEEKIEMDTSNTVNLSMASLKAEEPQIKAQVVSHMANRGPRKQKHKKEREVSCAKQNIQLQNMFQKHILDSFYAYIPLSSNFGGQKGRLTIADVKRELSPKYLSMKIPKHPILQILGNTGRGTPSNRKKLEYNFNRSKKISLWREEASGIFIRSLSISMMSPSQTKETVVPETNLESAKRTCLSKFPHKSPNTSKTVKRDSSSTVKEGDQNSTSTVPQDSQPFVVDEQQMNKLPSAKSEANLSSEANQSLTPQTKECVVPGHDISSIVKEPDLLTIEQEKAPKSIQTPTDCPFMPEDPNENVETHMKSALSTNIPPLGVEEPQCETQLFGSAEHAPPPEHGDQSEPVQDTATQTLQQQKTPPGTEPKAPQVKSNEIKIAADSPRAESLLPLYEAIKNVFEAQVKNMIQDKIYADLLEKVKDDKPGNWEAPPSAGSADTTSTITHPKVQPKPIVESFTCEGKNKLTNHLESKAPEINLNLTPEMIKQSFQKLSCYPKQAISKHNTWRLNQRHKKMCFLSLRGIDTVKFNLKHKYQKDSPLVSCMKTLTVNVSSGSEEIITKLKRINELESRTPSLISAGQMPLPRILQNYSVKEKDKLLLHFSMKTLEVQMKTFPRIVRESYTMASAQDRRKLLSKCIHSDVKVPKRENRILLLVEEKSLHQIDLDLRYKYTRFLLGLPVKSMFPKPNTLPKHILKLHTVAICKKVDSSGESGGLPIDTGPLEQHLSFKKQSPRENSSLINTFLEPQQVCSSDPDQHSTVQEDTTALSNLKSHVTPGKDKQCHVWFQDTNTCESVDLKTRENAHDLVDSHSIQNFEDSTDSHTNTESSETWGGCSALDAHDSEECVFLEANSCLSQESQSILFELQKGMPLANLYRKKKIKTDLKPFYTEDTGSHHIRGCRKHSSVVTPPSCDSHKSRKYRSSSKMQSRDSCNSSLTTVDLSTSSFIPFSDEKLSQTTKSRKNYSLVPLTESNIKLHLSKSQGKPHRHSESKERKKAKCDSFRKNNIPWECDYSYTQSKEKRTRKKKERDFESERSDYFPSERKSASEPHPEESDFLSEGKPSQPFFYACIPADSLEIVPKTIRWTIPPKTLRKKDFRVPVVAKISSSYNLWSSSKKLLGSLLESFSLVRQK